MSVDNLVCLEYNIIGDNMDYKFFAMISRMKYINRWALMRNTINENISEHSLEVAFIAHALALLGNKRLGKHYNAERAALLAMYHDTTEINTGDLLRMLREGIRESIPHKSPAVDIFHPSEEGEKTV